MKRWQTIPLSIMLTLTGAAVVQQQDTPVILPVSAQEDLTLTLQIEIEGKKISEVPLQLYQVATGEVEEYELSESWKTFEENLAEYDLTKSIQAEALAKSLEVFLKQNQIDAFDSGKTNAEGELLFEGLEKGLYFVPSTVDETEEAKITTGAIVLWLFEDTVAIPKDSSSNPEQGIPEIEPNDPSAGVPIRPGAGSSETVIPEQGSSTSASINNVARDPAGQSIGIGAKEPASAASVNTAVKNDQKFYSTGIAGALLVLSAILLLFKKKESNPQNRAD